MSRRDGRREVLAGLIGGALWTVFRDPIQTSPAQVARFAQLFPINARPPQGRGRRFLIETM